MCRRYGLIFIWGILALCAAIFFLSGTGDNNPRAARQILNTQYRNQRFGELSGPLPLANHLEYWNPPGLFFPPASPNEFGETTTFADSQRKVTNPARTQSVAQIGLIDDGRKNQPPEQDSTSTIDFPARAKKTEESKFTATAVEGRTASKRSSASSRFSQAADVEGSRASPQVLPVTQRIARDGPRARLPLPTRAETSPAPQSSLPWTVSSNWDDYQRSVFSQADALVQQGYLLAHRGAVFSARREFTQALLRVAGALDARLAHPFHQRALQSGLRALEELEDFSPDRWSPSTRLNLETTVSAHQTPVLRSEDVTNMTPEQAVERYVGFASEQIAAAAAEIPVGSMAMYGLARVQPLLSRPGRHSSAFVDQQRSLALFQAALMVDERNFMAANRLAEIYAEYGHYAEAKRLLQRSLAVAERPQAWELLAFVHERLGETGSAKHAASQAAATRHAESDTDLDRPPIVWMRPAEFARQPVGPGRTRQPVSAATRPTQSVASQHRPPKGW